MLLISPDKMTAYGAELSFSIRNIQFYNGCDGISASVFTLNTDETVIEKIGESEVVYHYPSYEFKNKFSLNYRFEKLQRLKFVLNAYNETTNNKMGVYGECLFDLSLVFANGGILSLPIPSTPSSIDINAKIPDYYTQYIQFKFKGSHIHANDGLPSALYFILSIPTGDRVMMLHKSEVVKDTKNPQWESFNVPLFVLNFWNDSAVQIHCYNQIVNHPDALIGYCSTTLTQLQRGTGFNNYMLLNSNGSRINEKTCIEMQDIQFSIGPTFFEMLKNKTNIVLTEAIDLTASNGNPVNETSLHYIHPHRPSPYLKAILDVTPPLLGYLPNPSNPEIGALGFGANVLTGSTNQLSHCFFLNGTLNDHRVPGLVGLIEAYRNGMMSVQPFGPTDFSEVIYFISKFAKAESRKKLGLYFVLVILSDGGPANSSSMKRTVDAIVDASYHPMSVIAVGVGTETSRDFSPMRKLESMTLKHSDGRTLARQNYTFVEDRKVTSTDALSMIPIQMIQWKEKFGS